MIQKKLPLTIQKGNIRDSLNNMKLPLIPERLISIKQYKSLVKAHGFYKPISKIITINGTREKI